MRVSQILLIKSRYRVEISEDGSDWKKTCQRIKSYQNLRVSKKDTMHSPLDPAQPVVYYQASCHHEQSDPILESAREGSDNWCHVDNSTKH